MRVIDLTRTWFRYVYEQWLTVDPRNQRVPAYGLRRGEIEDRIIGISHKIWGRSGFDLPPPDQSGRMLLRIGKFLTRLSGLYFFVFFGFLLLWSYTPLLQWLFSLPSFAWVLDSIHPAVAFGSIWGAVLLAAIGFELIRRGKEKLRLVPLDLAKKAGLGEIGELGLDDRRERHGLSQILGTVAMMSGIYGTVLWSDYFRDEPTIRMFWFVPVIMAVFGGFLVFRDVFRFVRNPFDQFKSLFRRGPSATEVLKSDPRKPILYLRSFMDDDLTILRTWTTGSETMEFVSFEAAIADQFKPFGPLIAIGRPGASSFFPTRGASRDFVSDAEWQEVVTNWLEEAFAVLLVPGLTEGVQWELDKVEEGNHVGKLIILLPPSGGQRSVVAKGKRFFRLFKQPEWLTEDQMLRWRRLRSALVDMPRFNRLPEVPPNNLIAIHLGRDGELTFITGPSDEEHYELAVRYAIFGMFYDVDNRLVSAD